MVAVILGVGLAERGIGIGRGTTDRSGYVVAMFMTTRFFLMLHEQPTNAEAEEVGELVSFRGSATSRL